METKKKDSIHNIYMFTVSCLAVTTSGKTRSKHRRNSRYRNTLTISKCCHIHLKLCIPSYMLNIFIYKDNCFMNLF